jgi:hypothetical protein
MSKTQIRRAIAIGVAALFVLIGAISMAEAGRGGGAGFKGGGFKGGSAFRGGNIHVGGGGGAKFHTNQGGKYAYRGGGGKFHTNQGGKYGKGWSGKFDNHHRYSNYGHYRRYGLYGLYGLPLYSYGGGCGYLYQRAVATNSPYWWDRYRRCTGTY